MAVRRPNESHDFIVEEPPRNRALVFGLAIAGGVLVLAIVAFMLLGPAQNGGVNRTNVNVAGQGQQPPGQAAQPGNVQVNVNGTMFPSASPTATRPPTVTPRPSAMIVVAPTPEVIVVTATSQPSATPSVTSSPTPSTTPTATIGR